MNIAAFRSLTEVQQIVACNILESVLQLTAEHIVPERARQDTQWGGPEHDDQHAPNDWMNFIQKQAGMLHNGRKADSPTAARERFVKIAALAVAAIQSIDRKNPPVKEECDCAGCKLERSLAKAGINATVTIVDGANAFDIVEQLMRGRRPPPGGVN